MNPRQTRLTPTTILVLAGTILIATVMGAAFLQSFTFPQSTPPPPPVVTGCAAVATSTASVTTGSSGILLFKCGTSPAFTSTAGSATPSFTLPTGVTGVGYTQDSVPNCPGTSLTSGTPVTFTAGSWDYCVSYTNYPASPPSLTVTWN